MLSVGDVKKDDSDIIIPDSKEESGGDFIPDDGSSISGISELVEERISELEKERINNREKLKSRSFRKQLVLAEEFEKKQAYTGTAAQPMRLEGIKIGSTNIGYFDVDADNIITRTISWQAFKRDHGSPQILAVNLNFIAVGGHRRCTKEGDMIELDMERLDGFYKDGFSVQDMEQLDGFCKDGSSV
ncbi:unnamed protein product [Thlaspi arvense]|uniref:Uncharacterized protein n=1 Tax=Thlaspi arvense TaxID=13288 RepID=A0AAU9SMD8_THLAR|nr:unnamed protein product [Thlaspi arvense]